jgi:hypothetical protein
MGTVANIADIFTVKITQVSTLFSVFACVYGYVSLHVGKQVCLCVYPHIFDRIRIAESRMETGLFEHVCLGCIVLKQWQ